jgi:hypothetical protein
MIFSLALCLWAAPAYAARNFTVVQTPSPVDLLMGSTNNPLTFRVTNNSTAGETITTVRFTINNIYTALPNPETFVAPTGWTCTRSSNTRVTCTASSSYYLTPGNYRDFTFNINSIASTQDRTDQLASAQARFSGSTTWRTANSTTSSWRWKALSASFQITDLSGTPITDLVSGNSFRLIMTVTNRSTATQTSIVTSPNPPTATVTTGTVTLGLTSTTYNPNPLTLAPGASGTITFQYSTNSGDGGTVYFTAYARNNTGTATSKTINSITLSVGQFTAAIQVSPICAYFGQTITVTMTLTNNYIYRILNVTPTLTTTYTGVTLVSGPTPPAPNGPVPAKVGSTPGTFIFTWVYQINATSNPGETFIFTGSATGTGDTGGSPTRTTPTATSPTVKRGGFSPTVTPITVDASSTNVELTWGITNLACTDIKSVSIAIPSGWILSGETYSLVDQYNPPNPGTNPIDPIENIWAVAGTTFSTTTSPYYLLPLTSPEQQGEFRLVFSNVPSTTGSYTFDVTIIDANDVSSTRPTTVTVNPLTSSTPVTTNSWKENY